MSGFTQFGGAVPGTAEGDPGKYAYLRNPNWEGNAWSRELAGIDPRACPGCIFGGHKSTPHVEDERCSHFRTKQAAADIEAGKTKGAERSEVDAMVERMRAAK